MYHRYLREVDCSQLISKYKIHVEQQAHVAGPIQTKLAQNKTGMCNCLVNLPNLSAYLVELTSLFCAHY
jgi:hypothetical protein